MPVPAPSPSDPTLLLTAAAAGDTSARDQLLPLVYDQLRRAAQLHLTAERSNHTLSATALVHEAYLKLLGPRDLPWQNRAHFYAAIRSHCFTRASARLATTPLASNIAW